MALAGPRALLMQAAHPLAVSGLLAHSSALDEPYERLARTAEVMSTITFGTRADADRVTRGVRAMHGRVSGSLKRPAGRYPAGTPYRASDPELLLWVLYTLVDSALVVYGKYVEHHEPGCAGGAVGRLPDRRGAVRPAGRRTCRRRCRTSSDYGREMLAGDELHVTDWARTRAREIVLEPPVPAALRPVVEAVNFITITLLPERIRREYGFRALPPGVGAAGDRERRRRVREARRDPVPARAAARGAGRARGLTSGAPGAGPPARAQPARAPERRGGVRLLRRRGQPRADHASVAALPDPRPTSRGAVGRRAPASTRWSCTASRSGGRRRSTSGSRRTASSTSRSAARTGSGSTPTPSSPSRAAR